MAGCTCADKRCDKTTIQAEEASHLVMSCMETLAVAGIPMDEPDNVADQIKAFREENEQHGGVMLTFLACEGAAEELLADLSDNLDG